MKSEARDGLSAAAMPKTLDGGSDSSGEDRNVPGAGGGTCFNILQVSNPGPGGQISRPTSGPAR
ncbi:hypothetical protein GCM10022223_31080 [Kineosporia mesophila]|uniref:Uncharacterized protein n=1 Tax=Kineosporia mesophila TaxID=566012 RepID=A0ABP6ZLM8_9ACTN